MTPIPEPTKPFAGQSSLTLLAMLVFGEARGETFEGKLAVANVPLNRLEAHGYGSDLTTIILRPWQFSCFNVKDPNRALLLTPLAHGTEQTWSDCYYAAYLAMTRFSVDPSRRAIFYRDASLTTVPADWGPVAETAAVGRLTFYKPVAEQLKAA